MHHKILKHLLSLFFVLVLLSLPGMQQENSAGKTTGEIKGESKNGGLQEKSQHRKSMKKKLEIIIY